MDINIQNASFDILSKSNELISNKTSKPIIELIANILTESIPEESYINSKIQRLEYDLLDINDKIIAIERELIYSHILIDKYEYQNEIIEDLNEQNEVLTKTVNESNNNINYLITEINKMKIHIAKYDEVFDHLFNLNISNELPLINTSFDKIV